MVFKRRAGLLLSSALAGACLAAAPALAQDAAQTDKLQRQVNELQKQLQALEGQISDAKQQAKAAQKSAQSAEKNAQTAQQALQNVPPGVFDQAHPGSPLYTKAPPSLLPAGVTVSFANSFIEAAGVWRQHNEVADGASNAPFSSMPFPNSPLYHEDELRFSARQSRIAAAIEGDIDQAQRLGAYYEMDFLGAGVTANSRESNSYQPRIRQAFLSYDNDNYHFHLMAGQGWSMLTQNRVGITPLYENIPLTIDAQYVTGFNWARQPEFRFVEDWNKVAWFGVSVESPQINFPSNSVGILGAGSQSAAATAIGGVNGSSSVGGQTVPPGLTLNDLNVCQASGLLDSATGCSADEYPDIIEKFALDPGWGHYEVVGLQRFFSDRVYTALEGSGTNKTHTGWGIGGSFLVPAWPKVVDVQGSVLTGEGLGRYGSAQLPDATIGPGGGLVPLRTTQALLGLVAHPWDSLDVYAYAGEESVNSSFWSNGKTNGGYGNPLFLNNGCLLENQGSGPAGYNDAIAGTTCTANAKDVQEITVGFWQNLYQGAYGRLRFGVQYEYFKIDSFAGVPGPVTTTVKAGVTTTSTPNEGINPYNQAVFVSLRYYPFNPPAAPK